MSPNLGNNKSSNGFKGNSKSKKSNNGRGYNLLQCQICKKLGHIVIQRFQFHDILLGLFGSISSAALTANFSYAYGLN